MLDWARWNVVDMEVDCSVGFPPTVTAEVELDTNNFGICHGGMLMDDLRERLGTQPKTLWSYSERPTPSIKKVIFNDPATIIMWNDGSKTVVKCQSGDVYDPEKGFVMAYLKKLLGNDNTFNKEIGKWVKYDG